MKVTIEIVMDSAAFDIVPKIELKRILSTIPDKVSAQMRRSKECVCVTPEIDDKLLDMNGNTVGFVRLED